MNNTQLIQLLKQLSNKEIRLFGEYVQSPYFNKQKKLQKLWSLIEKAMPSFSPDDLKKDQLYKHIFEKHQAFDIYRINNLISDLLQLLLQFLSQQQFEKSKVTQQQLLNQRLIELDAPIILRKQLKKMERLLDQAPQKKAEWFHQLYQYQRQLDDIAVGKKKRTAEANLQLTNDAFDRYYLCNKLRMACDMQSRNMVVAGSYKCHLLKELLAFHESDVIQSSQQISVIVYEQVLKMLEYPEQEFHFVKAKALLDEHGNNFPEEELQTLYTYLINYCAIKVNSGQSQYYQSILELYKALLDRAGELSSSKLTQWTYKNIVTVGIRVKDFDWVEQFIYEYNQDLPIKERTNALAYNLASYHLAIGNHSKALEQLQDVVFTDPSYHIGAKIIQLKCYYHLKEFTALLALLEAFRTYVQRTKKIAPYRKKANLNLLRLTKRMYRLNEQKELLPKVLFRKKFRDVQKQVKELVPLANKDWLMECMEQL